MEHYELAAELRDRIARGDEDPIALAYGPWSAQATAGSLNVGDMVVAVPPSTSELNYRKGMVIEVCDWKIRVEHRGEDLLDMGYMSDVVHAFYHFIALRKVWYSENGIKIK